MNYISDVLRAYAAILDRKKNQQLEQIAEDMREGVSEADATANLAGFYYGRIFDELETQGALDNFGAPVSIDQSIISRARGEPLDQAKQDLGRWWEGRVKQFLNDLSAVDQEAGQTYLQEIFSRVNLGQANLNDVAPVLVGSFVNGYLMALTASDRRNELVAGTAMEPTSTSNLVNSLIAQTLELIERLLVNKQNEDILRTNTEEVSSNLNTFKLQLDKSLVEFIESLNEQGTLALTDAEIHELLEKEPEENLVLGQDIEELPAPPELTMLKVECELLAVSPDARANPEKLGASISEYLFTEINGKFNIQLLMDALIKTNGDSNKYTLNQQKCVEAVFDYAFKLVDAVNDTLPTKEEAQQRKEVIAAEIKSQANISKQEVVQIITAVNDFSRHLDNIKMPKGAEPVTFNQEAGGAIRHMYGSNGRRVSSSEKEQLANTIIASAQDTVNKLPKEARLSLTQVISHFVTSIKEWVVSAIFSRPKATDNISLRSGDSGRTTSSTDSSMSRDSSRDSSGEIKPTAAPKNQVVKASERKVSHLKEGLQKAVAPPPSSRETPKPSRPS